MSFLLIHCVNLNRLIIHYKEYLDVYHNMLRFLNAKPRSAICYDICYAIVLRMTQLTDNARSFLKII